MLPMSAMPDNGTGRRPDKKTLTDIYPTLNPAAIQRKLGRTGAPCQAHAWWVSPARPPNPPCDSHRNGLSTCPTS